MISTSAYASDTSVFSSGKSDPVADANIDQDKGNHGNDGITAKFNHGHGVLSVDGDKGANHVTVGRDAAGTVLINGGAVDVKGPTPTVGNVDSIEVSGNDGNDVLTVDSSQGALPHVTLSGGDGNDVLTGGSGDDLLDGGNGNDTLNGGAGDDRIFGRFGNDRMLGGAGDDELEGGRGADRLNGEAGNDTLNGGYGNDRLQGGPGNDTIRAVAGGKDRISCGPGSDHVFKDRTDVVSGDCEVVNGKKR
jgi:Ca2+-binding RTX toxin-like protein